MCGAAIGSLLTGPITDRVGQKTYNDYESITHY